MIRKAPSPVPFEGGLECRPEDRAAPALVIEPTGRRFAPPCPPPPRVDCCRDARARASGTRRALAGAPTRLRRRLSWRSTRWLRPKATKGCTLPPSPSARAAAVAAVRRRVINPRTRTRVPRRASVPRAAIRSKASRQLEARNALASPAAVPGTARHTVGGHCGTWAFVAGRYADAGRQAEASFAFFPVLWC